MYLIIWSAAILAPGIAFAAAVAAVLLGDAERGDAAATASASVGLVWAMAITYAVVEGMYKSDADEKARLRKAADDSLDLSKRLLDENVLMRHRLDYHIAKPYWAEDGWTSGMKLRHSTDQPRIPSITKREREAIEALAGDAP